MNIYLMKKPKKLNSVSITLGIFGIILAYTCWFLVPAFWPVFQLTGIMRGSCNDAYRNFNDDEVMAKLLKEAARTRLRVSKDNFRITRIPHSEEELKDMSDGQKDVLTKRGRYCVIEMHYEDDYTWPIIGKTSHLVFDREVKVDLVQVTWEKACTCVTASRH